MSSANANRPTKNERRQEARDQAKQAREQQQKKEKRNRFLMQGGIAAAIIAVAVVVTLVIVQNTKPEGPGPLNMATGGAVFEENFAVVPTPALQAGDELVTPTVQRDTLPLDIVIYADYACSFCGTFEQENKILLDDLLETGTATVELRSMTMLSDYSTRAANAFACVVNYAPESAWKLNSQLLSAEVQPLDRPGGLTNAELLQQIELAGAPTSGNIKSCVEEKQFAGFLNAASNKWLAGPIPNLAEGVSLAGIRGTPTVIVNGQVWDPTSYPLFSEFLFIVQDSVESTTPVE